MHLRASLCAVALLGCAAEPPSTEIDTAEITNPDSDSVPEYVVEILIYGVHASSTDPYESVVGHCSGVVIDPHWVVTSSHCFADFILPPWANLDMQLEGETFGSVTFEPEDVHFHPEAWPDGEVDWETDRPGPDQVMPAHDLAIIHVTKELPTVARLYHPADPDTVPMGGRTIKLAGFANNTPRTGHASSLGIVTLFGGKMIRADRSPSENQPGDSGGAGIVKVANGLPASATFNKLCAPTPGDTNDSVVVGIIHGKQDPYDYLTPIYLPENLDFIIGYLGDLDHDYVCDSVDNCKLVKNNQDNCNVIAETTAAWESDGTILGDACDPNPCPQPSLKKTDFQQTSWTQQLGDALITHYHGKAIYDELDVTGILGKGDPLTVYTRTRFCLCRDSAGTPIDDPDVCSAAPFHCTLDPHQLFSDYTESGGGTPGAHQTYWHKITTEVGLTAPETGAEIPSAFPHDKHKLATWKYVGDYNLWSAAGWVPALATDPKFGPTRDLGGVLWGHSNTKVGAFEHGYPEGDSCLAFEGDPMICTAADGFQYGVGPELRHTSTASHKIPRYKPRPWWEYCAPCDDMFKLPGEDVTNPPFLTFDLGARAAISWSADGGASADLKFSRRLFDSLVDSTKLWVGASEPIAITNRPGSARALMLSSDGTTVLGEGFKGATQFDLRPLSVRATMTRRSGFAVAYSRTADALFVVGGSDSAGRALADAWTYRAGRWTSVAISAQHVPTNVLAAVFSHADLRMWIVSEPVRGERHLLRLDPATGIVDTDVRLAQLAGMVQPYLTTFEDGSVVLSGTTGNGVLVGMLRHSARTGITVTGQRTIAGVLGMAPAVAHSNLALPLEVRLANEEKLVPMTIPQAQMQ